MATMIPPRLLCLNNGRLFLVDTWSLPTVPIYDIISYRWGNTVQMYHPDIPGVQWKIKLSRRKLKDIRRLMESDDDIKYLWCDALCINQQDPEEQSREIARMYEYYKNARVCHILMDMIEPWDPQDIVEKFSQVDQVIWALGRVTRASEMSLEPNLRQFLREWGAKKWVFTVNKPTVQSAGVEMGVLNCYATCAGYVMSLFHNLYFTRVWTFQEMLLGRNITMWGINRDRMTRIGQLDSWLNLASDARDKAKKLQKWIIDSREEFSEAVVNLIGAMEEDKLALEYLEIQVLGISAARMDIVNGGPYWWLQNHKGISNVFSAVSWRPRKCGHKQDIFRGLLGVFHGLFTPDEIKTELSRKNVDALSFAFFRKLSEKTEFAWTRLAISSGERTDHNWIPRAADYDVGDSDDDGRRDEDPEDRGEDYYSEEEEDEGSSKLMTTDCFAGVVRLGRFKVKGGLAKTEAITGLEGAPRKYMKITFKQNPNPTPNSGMNFTFRGCNCGKKVKTGRFKSEPIPTYDQPRDKAWGETGRTLVECATILSNIFSPDQDVRDYRRRLLTKLQPQWNLYDTNAKPPNWVDRCVSGGPFENPIIRVHNFSMNYNLRDWTGCRSRLQNENTENVICEVRVNCGCVVSGPFSLMMEAITSVSGSSLGEKAAVLDADNRIHLHDGLGLVQLGDVGAEPKVFHLVCFGGNENAHKLYSVACRKTKDRKPIEWDLPWPSCRALVRDEFSHGMMDKMRDYGYVQTGGSGNLLICRNHIADHYRIIGVCIDGHMASKKGEHSVTIK
ncbi:hypothetical protein K402DRAFT_445052 [Aulographum hederae CBS 113979]|uniref:Heterokaryon incompatibility domain-containing protein n=1 Tax=Aulographum hederae CBS 113979 TaxID=1176131 RepID=A0A6G1H7M1_9PEZI|nr:hypothetical protein K402DRAFT_445052 [Aulographum hederae CBS 113979]